MPQYDRAMSVLRVLGYKIDIVLPADEPPESKPAPYTLHAAPEGLQIAEPAAVYKINPNAIQVPLLSVEAAAGAGAEVEYEYQNGFVYFDKAWLNQRGLYPGKIVLITARGKSMEPNISNGDVVLINKADRKLKVDEVVVAKTDHGLVIKRLSKIGDQWILASDDRAFGMLMLESQDDIVGKVVWRGGVI